MGKCGKVWESVGQIFGCAHTKYTHKTHTQTTFSLKPEQFLKRKNPTPIMCTYQSLHVAELGARVHDMGGVHEADH